MKNNIPLWKKLVQCMITFGLVWFICAFATYLWGEAVDDLRPDQLLAYDMTKGEYGACVDYFTTVRYVYSTAEINEPEYERYKEFVEFYDNYIMWVEYTAYDENNDTEKYVDVAADCVLRMEQIATETTFFENEPHYEYLLSKVNGE